MCSCYLLLVFGFQIKLAVDLLIPKVIIIFEEIAETSPQRLLNYFLTYYE